jgi:hypothetical protein
MAMNDNNPQREQAWMAAARNELEHGAQTLDALTVARLRAARLRALAAQPSHSAWLDWRPLAGVSLVLALVVGLVRLQEYASVPSEYEAAEVMSAVDEGFEFYENLEFYEWLEAQGDEDKRKS